MEDASPPTLSHPPPEAHSEAPARVNLIGEHTDYCQGLVLPLPLFLHTNVELRRRLDRQVVARTTLGGGAQLSYRLGDEHPGRGWLDYLQGVTAVLRQQGLAVGGVELDIASDIPAGAGLASSAALGVAVLRALRSAFLLPTDDLTVARLAHASETDFVGAPVGLMDPLAASLGTPGRALFIDTRSLAMEDVELPVGLEVGVLHSGISHHNAGGTYAQRRREADAAARALGVPALRDVAEVDLKRLATLAPPLDRRARHVVTENARVLAFVAALRGRDVVALGGLLDASHRSLRDDYEVSHPDVDVLVALAQAEPDVLGARMTGGGCGGAVLFLTAQGQAQGVGTRLVETYRARTGRPGALLVPAPKRV
ncbi:MAG: galactokinase [Myxococcaceae bacterium]